MRGHTIQEFIETGDRLTAWCQDVKCRHHAVLDMAALRDRLGPDHGAMHDDLVPLLKCSKCRGKKIGLIRSPRGNGQYVPTGVHTGYYKR